MVFGKLCDSVASHLLFNFMQTKHNIKLLPSLLSFLIHFLRKKNNINSFNVIMKKQIKGNGFQKKRSSLLPPIPQDKCEIKIEN